MVSPSQALQSEHQRAETECDGVNCQLNRVWNHLVMPEGDNLPYIN